jgi:hypothetical protein
MKFSLPTALALATTLASAAKLPAPTGPQAIDGCRPKKCLTQAQADQYVERFTHVLEHTDSDLGDYLTTVDVLLSENFQEISGSINSLAGFDVSIAPATSSRNPKPKNNRQLT